MSRPEERMEVVLVTGGARSGKSAYAQSLAQARGGEGVIFLATGRPVDEEMARRIERHRGERPSGWATVERGRNVGPPIVEADNEVVLLDCLTLLVANALTSVAEPRSEDACLAAAGAEVEGLLLATNARSGTLIVVTNEVGMGVVPTTPLGRWFRDAQGRANQKLAARASRVVLLVSGQPLTIKG